MSLNNARHVVLGSLVTTTPPTPPTPPTPGTYQLQADSIRGSGFLAPYRVYHLGVMTDNFIRYLKGNPSASVTPLYGYEQRPVVPGSTPGAAAICRLDPSDTTDGIDNYSCLVVDYPDGLALLANTPISLDFSSPLALSTLTWADIEASPSDFCLVLGIIDGPTFYNYGRTGAWTYWSASDTPNAAGTYNVSTYTVV